MTARPHQLEVHVDGEPTLHLGPFEMFSGATLDLGTLRFGEPAFVKCRATFPKAYHATARKLWLGSPKYRIYHEFRAGDDRLGQRRLNN